MTPRCRLGSKWRIVRSLRSMMRPGVSGPTSFILTMTFLPTASTRAYFGLSPYSTPPNFPRKLVLIAAVQAAGSYRSPDAVFGPPSRHPRRNGLYVDAAPTIAAPEASSTTSLEWAAATSPRAAAIETANVISAPQTAAFERNSIITPRLIFLDRPVLDAANMVEGTPRR